MKNLLRHIMCCLVLLTFTAACGKENKSGGGSRPPVYNPVAPVIPASPNLSGDSAVYLQELNTWLANPDAQISIGLTGHFRRTVQSSGNFSLKAFWKELTGNYRPTHCYMGTIGGVYSVGTPSGVDCVNRVSMPIASNTKVIRALNGENNTLSLLRIVKSGMGSFPRYYLEYGTLISADTYNPNRRPVVIYIIDTGAHSIFNPIQITDYRTGTDDFMNGTRIILNQY